MYAINEKFHCHEHYFFYCQCQKSRTTFYFESCIQLYAWIAEIELLYIYTCSIRKTLEYEIQ